MAKRRHSVLAWLPDRPEVFRFAMYPPYSRRDSDFRRRHPELRRVTNARNKWMIENGTVPDSWQLAFTDEAKAAWWEKPWGSRSAEAAAWRQQNEDEWRECVLYLRELFDNADNVYQRGA
jgi:hypothetical protein